MKIWFFKRELQLGDYVYADGSTSDLIRKDKTIVGVCFYIDPDDRSHRLCVAPKALTAYPWGLYSTNWSEGITLADSPGYNVFDVPTLTNKIVGAGITISATNYRDETSAGDGDGFAFQAASTALGELGWEELTSQLGGYPEGTKLPWGLINTLKIIAHRNIILSDTNINLPQPQKIGNQSKLDNLIQLIRDVVSNNSNAAKYQQFYYPPASQCNAYEPSVKAEEPLDERFKAGKWFLPSAGELVRLYWWHSHNKLQEEVTNGIFAKHIAEGVFTALTANLHWSSTEYNTTYTWGINFSSGFFTYSTKSSTSPPVIAVCAF